MSDHPQDEQWDKALRAHPPIKTGRLDMASCTIDGEPVRYLYCDAWPERVAISGDHCDYIAYAANRAQPLMADNDRLRAENERLNQWHSIETAPHDGHTWILGYEEDTQEMSFLIFDSNPEEPYPDEHPDVWTDGYRVWHPTHWREHPVPPTATAE